MYNGTHKDLLFNVCDIWGNKTVAEKLGLDQTTIKKWLQLEQGPRLDDNQTHILAGLLPSKPKNNSRGKFTFIDLFAGIGGLRKGFEAISGDCLLTSEWNKYSVKTYKANYYCDPENHIFNEDIRDITKSNDDSYDEDAASQYIDENVPDHDVLLAGFPCQPFSLAGVSKKNSLGRSHGFECKTQGTLFFDVARILTSKKPSAFVLENVKNLKSHDGGNTFKVIIETLEELGYWIADINLGKTKDPKIIDGQHFLPQHRERIVLVGFKRDLNIHNGFTLKDIDKFYPADKVELSQILTPDIDDKYILTPRLWEYLYQYAKKHKAKGNGFGYGLNKPSQTRVVTRTLSARYHKDGSEILIDRGWDMSLGEIDFWDEVNQNRRPRRLSPLECSKLMGFNKHNEDTFKIPVSDTQAYQQFGNSVIVPVFESVAKLMESRILESKKLVSNKAT